MDTDNQDLEHLRHGDNNNDFHAVSSMDISPVSVLYASFGTPASKQRLSLSANASPFICRAAVTCEAASPDSAVYALKPLDLPDVPMQIEASPIRIVEKEMESRYVVSRDNCDALEVESGADPDTFKDDSYNSEPDSSKCPYSDPDFDENTNHANTTASHEDQGATGVREMYYDIGIGRCP